VVAAAKSLAPYHHWPGQLTIAFLGNVYGVKVQPAWLVDVKAPSMRKYDFDDSCDVTASLSAMSRRACMCVYQQGLWGFFVRLQDLVLRDEDGVHAARL
jgi:hypothetical protein